MRSRPRTTLTTPYTTLTGISASFFSSYFRLTLYPSLSANAPPPYNNTQFIDAFSQSFISLVRYYDVNVKFDPTNITPYWNKYDVGETEMLFNRTEEGVPVVRPIETDPALLERCAYVHFPESPWSKRTLTRCRRCFASVHVLQVLVDGDVRHCTVIDLSTSS